MNSSSGKATFAAMAAMLVAVALFQNRSAQSSSATTSQVPAKPLLLEKNVGERRIWREHPPGDFILKVSPKNNGSQQLVMGTEDMAPGDEFQTHKHLGQDELCISKKEPFTFIWENRNAISARRRNCIHPRKHMGRYKERRNREGHFQRLDLRIYMRSDSVLPNEKVTPRSLEGQKECSHQGHVIYKDTL